ncbi:A-kinase anchor protein 17A [Gastrophryne carolinensis]
MAAATIVHDTSEAIELSSSFGLYLKPISKMNISVALPQLKQPGKSISNWEVMERLKSMVNNHQFSTLRISKSTMDFIRFEGEVENKGLVKSFISSLDGKSIKLSGFSDILKVRAAEYKIDFPTRHDWDSFFRDAGDMNENLPGERPDTIHLEGLPCKWFAVKDSGSEKPNEDVLKKVFSIFGEIRNVDIPMLDPYREDMTGRNFHTFSFGGHLNFEAYVQYKEYVGFVKAMNALRGMKLMYRGDDSKAIACNIKVSFDTTKHLSEASIKKRHLERQKLQELEQRREEQKRKQKEAEERQKEEERKQKELEELEKEKKRKEKIKRKEDKQREKEARKSKKKMQKLQAEEQKRLQEKIRFEERKLLLSQRNLQSIRLIVELLSRVKNARIRELEEKEAERIHVLKLEERRRQQEAELRRVEEEKQRTLTLFRKERELREKLVNSFLNRNLGTGSQVREVSELPPFYPLQPSENLPRAPLTNFATSTSTQTSTKYEPLRPHIQYAKPSLYLINGVCLEDSAPQKCKQANNLDPGGPLYSLTSFLSNKIQRNDPTSQRKEVGTHQSNDEPRVRSGQDVPIKPLHYEGREHKTKHKRDLSKEKADRKKVKKSDRKHYSRHGSPARRSSSTEHSRHRSKDVKSRHTPRERRGHRKRSYSREQDSWSS